MPLPMLLPCTLTALEMRTGGDVACTDADSACVLMTIVHTTGIRLEMTENIEKHEVD